MSLAEGSAPSKSVTVACFCGHSTVLIGVKVGYCLSRNGLLMCPYVSNLPFATQSVTLCILPHPTSVYSSRDYWVVKSIADVDAECSSGALHHELQWSTV